MPLDRSTLSVALRGSDQESWRRCAAALDAGAPLRFLEEPGATGDDLAAIYERRATHVREIGLAVEGIDEAVDALRAQGPAALSFARVDASDGGFYLIVVSQLAAEVTVCIGVPGRTD